MMNVLYADDERGMLEVGKEFLEMSGNLNVEIAISATEALRMMADHRFDAIVSDYQMPDMNGLEFLRSVRVQDEKIPFILFTGRGREEIVIEACNAGVSAYLQKGEDTGPMFTELENWIEKEVGRQRTEMALLIKDRQATLAMDLAKIASWEYDPETMLFMFDDVFFSLYGTDVHQEGVNRISLEDFVLKFIHPEDKHMVVEWIEMGICSSWKDNPQLEHRIVRRDGKVRWVSVKVGAFIGASGLLEKVYGVVQDITDKKTTTMERGVKIGSYLERIHCQY